MAGDGFDVDFDLKERAMDEAPVGITISDPDRADNPLIYVNDAFERLTGYPEEEVLGRNCRFLQGEESDPDAIGAMREAIDAAEPVTVELVNYRQDGERFWNEVTVAPVRDGDGEVTNYVGFQTDVTARKRAEFALERERRNLEHLLDRINGLIGDVTRELVQAVDRGSVEAAVCERIAAADGYAFAWIGEVDPVRDVVVPSAWAGADVDPDALEVDVDAEGPVARAVREREVGVVGEADPAVRGIDADGMAAVPLVHTGSLYGVLVVYATGAGALDDREVVVLEALGRAAATALNAHESRRIISADEAVELEFETGDAGLFFVDLSERADCRLEYAGSVYRSDGSLSAFFTADADGDAVLAAAADVPDIEDAATMGEGLFEFGLAPTSIITELADRGGRIRSIVADAGAGRLAVELPVEADVRSIVDEFGERYPGSDLVAYRERERPPKTDREFVVELEDRLTERQLTALRKAYVSGYYDPNRGVSGDELAESMGITRATFHQHLRAAERKLIGEFIDR